MERFLGVEPEIVAHDLHPDYFSTHYAQLRSGPRKVGVQHHHAHVLSALAEHGIEGPVFGLAYDGTGYGTDGSSWGGELLLADARSFQRLATFRPIALPGGDQAVRAPWRTALAMLDDAFDGAAPIDDLPLFRSLREEEVQVVRRMLKTGLNAPRAHGVGRYFDAFAALALARPLSSFEGQLALEWNMAALAAPSERGRYPYDVSSAAATRELDLRPMVRNAVYELIGGEAPAIVSTRFHNTLAGASSQMIRLAAARHGRHDVVLTGGCFQNALLVERLLEDLGREFRVILHRDVPPGDGGISLGQAIAANACEEDLCA